MMWIDVSNGCGGHRGEYDWKCTDCGKVDWFASYTDPNKEGVKCSCGLAPTDFERERRVKMSDIVERLRKGLDCGTDSEDAMCDQAAEEIESLRQQLAERQMVCDRLKTELAECRNENLIKYGTTHPEMYKTELDLVKEQLAACQKDADIWRQKAIELGLEASALQKELDEAINYAKNNELVIAAMKEQYET